MSDRDGKTYDLVVLGGGAAGMTAALTARLHGLEPLLLESSACLGGATAVSAGSVWVPNALPGTSEDSLEGARRYLALAVGEHGSAVLREAFLSQGPAMIKLLGEETAVRFAPYPHHPDYLQHVDGATLCGRSLEPLPFDGRRLGQAFALLRPPIPEFLLLGGMMVSRDDIRHLLAFPKTPAAIRHVSGLLGRYFLDRLRWPRGTRLVMGNALAARLLYALRSLDIEIRTEASVRNLNSRGKEGFELTVDLPGDAGLVIQARRGVVLATGGFSHHSVLRQRLFPKPVAEHSVVPACNAGGGIELGLAAGGALGKAEADPAFWAPVSLRRRRDGTTAVFPHFVLDRGKPGLIAVNRAGRRFVNEATSYQRFVEAMYRAHDDAASIPCAFICDAEFLRRYGLGMIRPRQRRIAPFLKDGYLVTASTLRELAGKLRIDPAGLEESVARHNRFAAEGRDLDFAKGEEAYSRNLGDPNHTPNPCLGPLDKPPFFAVRVFPGDIGTSIGLQTDEYARVLRADGTAIAGLYACGNDMQSLMGGIYPGPGATIGPAMTFGYIAARHAARGRESRGEHD
ncbi:MAG: FAD-dependent oxidoreductase [Rhodovibrionaceae bacterium]